MILNNNKLLLLKNRQSAKNSTFIFLNTNTYLFYNYETAFFPDYWHSHPIIVS
jgi:hypothetical protein